MKSNDPIVVVPYDPTWPDLFARLAKDMRAALGDVALRIDHIGSTSIPQLAAKPVIDIQISVAAFAPLEAFCVPLESLGYVFRSENTELTKRYFRESPGQRRTHIHVRRAGSFSEQLALLFRDFMCTHPQAAEQYAQLKYKLAQRYRDNREAYVEAKQLFIWNVIAQASDWSQDIGWKPGPSDA
ncbi:MAG TPA: GrpB family protein [Ktedonobacteraceae bacterium]|nr:GrpB family protein [Ktedonobacteraceae bacterium]